MSDKWMKCLWAARERAQKRRLELVDDLDDSLTSLMWLQDFSVANTGMAKPSYCSSGLEPQNCPRIPSSDAPCSPLAADPACMGVPKIPCKPTSSSTSSTMNHTMAAHPQLAQDIDYKTNPHIKPPYSYANLICMAMEASNKPKITLSAIYKWITDNFCYFRHADPTWQNSIRHNLSLNKCFTKVPREKGEPGKGGFWKLDPQYADRLKNGTFKKRRSPPVQVHPALTEKAQQEAQCSASPAAAFCTSKNILNVNTESQQLLKEFEEVTSGQSCNPVGGKSGLKRKQPSPHRTARAPRLSNSALLTQEEETELGSLKGDFDWAAIFDADLNEDFSTFGDLDLTPSINPIVHDVDLTAHGNHADGAQGQEQVLTEPNLKNLDFDETFLATSFLQHPWDEGTNDCLSNAVNMEQLFDLNDASLPADDTDWASLASLL
ncbi:forkhead box protein J1-B-like [Pterocles gutturalis]